MNLIKNIPHPVFKITLYGWNQKYIIKIEDDLYEQTYKIPQYDLASVDEVDEVLNEGFLKFVNENFKNMHKALTVTLAGLNDF